MRSFLFRQLLFVSVSIFLALGILFFSLHRPAPNALPSFGQVPPFNLTERSGQAITDQYFRNKVWVADFIYTTCPGPCPALTQKMSQFQKQVGQNLKWTLVSFSVDPTADTPEVLRDYAKSYQADPTQWLFVTGDKKKVYDLIINGFHLPVIENDGATVPLENKFVHTTKVVLIDAHGMIRGYYDGLDDLSREKLQHDLEKLL